jgi:hypothetical protein
MAARRVIVAMILSVLGACEESAPQSSGQPPAQTGRRTSTYGKAMDRAEDLQKEVAEYNRQIERTIEQGTAAEPSKPPAPKRP